MAVDIPTNLDVRIPCELVSDLREAAANAGVSMQEFALAAIASHVRANLENPRPTLLSDRDRDRFLSILDDLKAEPGPALKAAAERYRLHLD